MMTPRLFGELLGQWHALPGISRDAGPAEADDIPVARLQWKSRDLRVEAAPAGVVATLSLGVPAGVLPPRELLRANAAVPLLADGILGIDSGTQTLTLTARFPVHTDRLGDATDRLQDFLHQAEKWLDRLEGGAG